MAHQNWVAPQGPPCPAPMSRADLLLLVASNSININCDYVINDHVQGTLAAGTEIHLQGVASNKLSANVAVNTLFDDDAWRGIYNITLGILTELTDNLNNTVRASTGAQVAQFDWGNPAYTDCEVDNGTLVVTYGNPAIRSHLIVRSRASLFILNHTGAIRSSTFEKNANVIFSNTSAFISASIFRGTGSFINFTGATGPIFWSDNVVENDTTINATGFASSFICNASRLAGSTIVKSAASGPTEFTNCQIYDSTITHTSVDQLRLLQVQVTLVSTISLSSGTIIMNSSEVTGGSTVSRSAGIGALICSRVHVTSRSQVFSENNVNTVIDSSEFYNSSSFVISNGSNTLGTVTDSFFRASTVFVGAASSGNIQITQADLHVATVSKVGSGQLLVASTQMASEGRIDHGPGARNDNVIGCTINSRGALSLRGTGGLFSADIFSLMAVSNQAIYENVASGGPTNIIQRGNLSGPITLFRLTGTTAGMSITSVIASDLIATIQNCLNLTSINGIHGSRGVLNFVNCAVSRQFTGITVELGGAATFNNVGGSPLGITNSVRVSGAGSVYNSSGLQTNTSNVQVLGGILNHVGQGLTNFYKFGGGTFNSNNLAHSNCIFSLAAGAFTALAANTNRQTNFTGGVLL